LASSPPGRFAPLDVTIPGRFTTSLDVSPPVRKFVICDTVRTSLSSDGETSREWAKRPVTTDRRTDTARRYRRACASHRAAVKAEKLKQDVAYDDNDDDDDDDDDVCCSQ